MNDRQLIPAPAPPRSVPAPRVGRPTFAAVPSGIDRAAAARYTDRPVLTDVQLDGMAIARLAPDAGIATGAHSWATGINVAEAQRLAAYVVADIDRLESVVRALNPTLDADAVRDRAVRLALHEIGAELSRDTFTVLRFEIDRARSAS
ncbi:MAG TPA: hypothetical protein VGD56_02560 [Gemmatirosa sp.]